MSFCGQVKNEIIECSPREGCCSAAHLYGLLLFSHTFSFSKISVNCENETLAAHIQNALREYGIATGTLSVKQNARGTSIRITDRDVLDRLFFDFGYTGAEPHIKILPQNLMCGDCLPAFVAGCFITGGNISHPAKGYHLEFSGHRARLFDGLEELLRAAGFDPRRTKRGYDSVLYFKNSGQIEDMLTFMGAVNSSLELMNTKILKDIKNTVNRRTNCETANIDKIVDSAARDREAITFIYQKNGTAGLPDELKKLAALRLDQPELSLAELGAMLNPPITKSGVSHRLRRLREAAEQLKMEN